MKGPAYIMTNDLPPLLYNLSFKTKQIWIEDVYNGVLLKSTSTIKINPIPEMFFDLFLNGTGPSNTAAEIVNGTFFVCNMFPNSTSMYDLYWNIVFENFFSRE